MRTLLIGGLIATLALLPARVALAQSPAQWTIPAEGEGEAGPEREGREEERIETDRDSFTPATTTAGRGRLIVESAYTFLDNRGVKETHSFPELLFRYGLTDRLELRLGWNYEVGGAGNVVSGAGTEEDFFSPGRLERESTLSYGVKVRATEQSGWVPGSAVILIGQTPTSGEATDTQFVGTYVWGWELGERWKLDAAIRYGTASEEEDRFGIWAPSVVLKADVGERWSVHAEYFALFSSGKEQEFTRHFFSPGAHYLITDDFEVGVRVGWGLNDQSARFFCNAGLGLRF
jgi:hypothetical protein